MNMGMEIFKRRLTMKKNIAFVEERKKEISA